MLEYWKRENAYLAHTALGEVTTDAGDVHSHLDAGFSARSIDDDVRTGTEFALLDHAGSVLLRRRLLAAEDMGGRVALGELEAVLIDIDRHSLRRAKDIARDLAAQ